MSIVNRQAFWGCLNFVLMHQVSNDFEGLSILGGAARAIVELKGRRIDRPSSIQAHIPVSGMYPTLVQVFAVLE
jgi:hypothetical protein